MSRLAHRLGAYAWTPLDNESSAVLARELAQVQHPELLSVCRYPVVTNSYIRWSRGAGYGQVMEQWHDRDLMKWECEQLQPAIGEIDMDLSN